MKIGLVVCCDWLLWQKLHVRGIDAVFIEAGLEDWDGDQLCEDLFVRTSDWAYIGDCDITEFQGVSLGRQFLRDLHLFLYTYSAFRRPFSISSTGSSRRKSNWWTCGPSFRSCRSVKLFMVQELAKSNQLKFIDAYEPIDPNDQDFAVGTNCFNIYANLLVTHRPTPNPGFMNVSSISSAIPLAGFGRHPGAYWSAQRQLFSCLYYPD